MLYINPREREGMDHDQMVVADWCEETFGTEICDNLEERCLRFLEEACELVQSLKLPKERAMAILDYVYARELGDPAQETGGVMVTLHALANAAEIRVERSFTAEIDRCWKNQEKIRNKQMAKPLRGTGLPE